MNEERDYVAQTDLGRMVHNIAKARLILMLAVVGLFVYCVLALTAALALGFLADWAAHQ